MKLKQAITGIAALACMTTAAHAQSAGSFLRYNRLVPFCPSRQQRSAAKKPALAEPDQHRRSPAPAPAFERRHHRLHAGLLRYRSHRQRNSKWASRPRSIWKAQAPSRSSASSGQREAMEPDSAVQILLQRSYREVPSVSRCWRERASGSPTQRSPTAHSKAPSCMVRPAVDTDSSWAPVFNVGSTYAFTNTGSRASPCRSCRSAPRPS